MINGSVVGLVLDNRDPDGMHRVLVRFPVDGAVASSWCRMLMPMAGKDRGLVVLPDIGTEVVLMYAYRTMSPYVLGAVYNGGEDPPEPYKNDDGNNDKRVFWSRNGHLLVFDDTPGAEAVGLGAQAATRLDVCSAPVHHMADAANKTLVEHCEGTTLVEAAQKISFACARFTLKANRVLLKAGGELCVRAGQDIALGAGGIARLTAPEVPVKTGSSPPWPTPAHLPVPARHNPSR